MLFWKENYMSVLFNEMNLSEGILKAINDMGFLEPTPIQAKSIEVISNGEDVIGQSQTGSGKTAAYAIPCLEKINPKDKRLQTVVLCPTRELAIQVSEQFKKLLKYSANIRTIPIYGGQSMQLQINEIKKGVQVVIGTPGRIIDHINRGTLNMENVRTIILDEADEMLDMGFREDIEEIMVGMPEDRQTILFSATMPKGILDLTKRFQNEPKHIRVAQKEMTVSSISQYYIELKDKNKMEVLCRLMEVKNPKLSIVFCNTKAGTDNVARQLQDRGYAAEALHGDLKQSQRDNVMHKFRSGYTPILVATDVAARGIDVYDIDIIFNYDLPQDAEYYVHRIGRTARAGKSGLAYTFVVGREIQRIREIMKYTKANIQFQFPPSMADIKNSRKKIFSDKVRETINNGELDEYTSIVGDLVDDGYSEAEIAAALVKMKLHDENMKKVDSSVSDLMLEPQKEYKNKEKRDNKGGGKKKQYNDADMIRLFINVGKNNNVRVNDIVGCLASESGVAGRIFGAIDIFNDFSFVDVPKEFAKTVIMGMENKKLKGVKVCIEKAKKDKFKAKAKFHY